MRDLWPQIVRVLVQGGASDGTACLITIDRTEGNGCQFTVSFALIIW